MNLFLARLSLVLAVWAIAACAAKYDPTLIIPGQPRPAPPPCTAADAQIACFTGAAVGPAARASKGTNPTPDLLAGGGGLTFSPSVGEIDHIPPGTYPLLQSAMVLTAQGASADASINSTGATLTVLDAAARRVRLTVPAINLDLTYINPASEIPVGDGRVFTSYLFSALDYHGAAHFVVADPAAGTRHLSEFVIGFRTPAASMPNSGSASYNGGISGHVMMPGGGTSLAGSGVMNVNFGTGVVTGALNGITISDTYQGCQCDRSFNHIAVSGSIVGGTGAFSGTTSVTTTPSHPFALRAGATGFIDGAFYGPGARELGAVWSLHDGVRSAIGTFDGGR